MRRLLVVVTVALAAVTTACGGGRTRTLTVVNDTDYEITVEVSAGSGDRTPLDTLGPHSRDVSDEVADQGTTWVFHFSSAGVDAGSLRLTRPTLSNQDWTVRVPPTAAARLQAARVAPAPRRGP